MYVPQPLGQEHRLDGFDCGKTELNTWLSGSAQHAARARTAMTFVWCPDGELDVVAYYSLAAHQIEKAEVPPKTGRGSPERIPAVLLARLALDKRLHGDGLGGVLLGDALRTALTGAEHIAARFVVVDAMDEGAAKFYSHYGFRRFPAETSLFRKISDIAADLG